MDKKELSSFQEMMQEDIATFLNEDEFASKHSVEGKKVLSVIAPDQNIPMGMGYTHGVSESAIVLYAQTDKLPKKKRAGDILNVNGKEYTVDSWDEQAGISVISLSHPEAF